MTVVVGLLLFFLLLDIAAAIGWVPTSRESRDWERPAVFEPVHRGSHTSSP